MLEAALAVLVGPARSLHTPSTVTNVPTTILPIAASLRRAVDCRAPRDDAGINHQSSTAIRSSARVNTHAPSASATTAATQR